MPRGYVRILYELLFIMIIIICRFYPAIGRNFRGVASRDLEFSRRLRRVDNA